MRNLILLLRKYGSLILFLILELIAFILIVNFNNKQRDIFLYSSNFFSGVLLEKFDAGKDYFRLNAINDSIAVENARLMAALFNEEKPAIFRPYDSDTVPENFRIIPARISNMTIHLRNNRFTLNKGTQDGIREGMGVLSPDGIIGVVHKANARFSSVMPIINTQMQVSAKVRTKKFFGDLVWEPYDERFMQLKHIPKHAEVERGDTVVTSGFSTIFPEGIPIGRIEEIALPAGSNYFDISVRLFNRIANLDYVYVIENEAGIMQKEIEE
jgi:rod shape-determining protein MreC